MSPEANRIFRSRRSRQSRWPRRLALGALCVAGAALVLQHLVLLVQRFADASIGEPAVLLRWLGAATTLAAAVALRRRGKVPWQGRTGLAFALAILLLHFGVAAPAASNTSALFLLPAGLLLAATAAWAVLLLGFAPRADRNSAPRRRFVDPACQARSAGFLLLFASRPPPVV